MNLTSIASPLRILISFVFMGAILGFFFLLPLNEFVYFYEHEQYEEDPIATNGWRFSTGQLISAIKGEAPKKTVFYIVVGSLIGAVMGYLFNSYRQKTLSIQQLSAALGDDLGSLIALGEGPRLEFKSSFRWDVEKQRVNKALEMVILKTLSGYLNGEGGTLLIGVSDDGKILGLEEDFRTLKRVDRDGYEQALMTQASTQLGTDVCQHLQILFHTVDEKDVCRVIVSPSHRPVFCGKGDARKFYLRTGGGTRELNVEEVVNYTSNRWS